MPFTPDTPSTEDVPMLRSIRVIAASLLILTAIAAHSAPVAPSVRRAADAQRSPIAGRWEADVQGDGKIFTFVFDFTVRGDSLGGTLSIAQREGEVRVAGTMKGDHLHFEQFGAWDGKLEKGTLRLTRGLDGGKIQHMVAHRVTKN